MTTPLRLRTVDDLDAPLLTRLLQRSHPGVQVRAVRVRRVHQGTSTHVHLDVDCSGGPGGPPQRLFVKTQLSTVDELPPGFDDALGEGGGATTVLQAEQAFYRDVAPGLAVETLVVHASEPVAGPGQFVIVAEDVTERGARFPDPQQTQPPEQVASLLTTLAELHACLWQSPRLAPGGDLHSLDSPTTGPFQAFLRTGGGWDLIRLLLQVPYKQALLAAAGVDAAGAEAAFWRLQERCAAGPVTLLHGDPHPGNAYVLPGGRVGLLDWQLVRRGSWVHDVGYAVVAALDPPQRRGCERDLLEHYLATLTGLGVRAPAPERAWDAYRGTPAWGLAMWSITPGEMYSDALVEAVLARFSAAFRDLDTPGALGLRPQEVLR